MKFNDIKREWLNGYLGQLKNKGFSKAEIARRLNILPQSLNNILNGNRGVSDSFIDILLEAFEPGTTQLRITAEEKSPARQVMTVTIHADDPAEVINAKGKEQETIAGLLDGLELDLGFFPKKGDYLSFLVGEYHIDATVYNSFLKYCEPGNVHYKESYWGIHYDVYLENIEIIERYK